MANYVTATITENVHSVLCLNTSDNSTVILTFVDGKAKSPEQALKAIQKRFDTTERKALYLLSTTSTENLYRLTESAFLENAEILDKRPTDIRYVTRTMEKATCKVLCINPTTKQTSENSYTTKNAKTPAELLAQIKTDFSTPENIPLYILSTIVNSALYGIPETKFIQLGEIVKK